MNSTDLAHRISDIIFTKKGFNVLSIDLRNLVSFTDYFVICSADSDTQVKAIADEVDKILSDDGIKCWHKEGLKALRAGTAACRTPVGVFSNGTGPKCPGNGIHRPPSASCGIGYYQVLTSAKFVV